MGRVLHSAVALFAFSVAYALSILVGRATRLGGGEVALVWPAAAVGIIWLLATHRSGPRERAIHIVTLGLVTFVMNVVTGAPVLLSGWFALVNVVSAVVTVWVLTYRRSEVVLRDPADLARLVAAVTIGVCCAAILATAFLAIVMDDEVWRTFALFVVRNGASALLGVSIWLRLRDLRWQRPRVSASSSFEALIVGIGVTAIFFWIFWLNTGVPMAFITLVAAAGIALRYSTTVSTVFVTAAGIWIIHTTLVNRGVFVVPEVETRALLAQAMVCSLTLIVLTLSLYRDSRARLISQLEVARDQADQDSELLGAVLDNIHDSVVLVDSGGEVVLQNARAAKDLGLVHDLVSAPRGSTPDGSTGPPTRDALRDVVVDTESSRTIELTTAPLARQSPLHVMAFRDVTEERLNARALREARDLFAGVLQAASEQAIIGTDPTGRIAVFNHGAERLLGWTQSEMLGRTPLDYHLPAEMSARAAELGISVGFEVLAHNVTPLAAEVREWTYVRRDHTRASVSLAVSQMNDEDGRCKGYICVATDITERKSAEQALAESEERFRLAFDTAPMGMFMFDVTPNGSGRITRCNEAMASMLGGSTADVLGTAVTRLGEDQASPIGGGLRKLPMLQIGDSFDVEVAFLRSDGSTVWGALSASVVAPRGSSPYGICLVEDITARKRVEAELQHLALHDRLTGLANRALFMDRVEHALAAERDTDSVGMIFLDLDGFKAINDTFGHAQGDEVLNTVAQRIVASIPPRDTAARLGGDEFAVLCPQVADLTELKAVAERIRAEVHRPISLVVGGTYDQLSVSGGVATSRPGCTAERLLQRADTLMYHAKRSGKDCVALSESSEEAALLRAVTLVPELERAVSLNEFIVRFQPIVGLPTGECVAAEALLRWDHPTRGVLAPAEFLTVAETSRHMSAIGRYVLHEACRQAQRWSAPMDHAAIHVNVSGRQLEVGDFRTDVLDALERTGLSPDRLVLELTETYAGRVANSAEADLEQLRRIGVRIAIDDVGTGFSGLAKIVDLPVDILKIDKQFVGGLPHDPRCEAITKAVLGLGSSLGLTVIAEGIETRVQRDLLAEWGCEQGQGFLFGRAMDGVEALATRPWA